MTKFVKSQCDQIVALLSKGVITHEPHFCACFLLVFGPPKKGEPASRPPVLRREAIAFEVCIREGEYETIVRNTSLQNLHSQHWKSCRSAPKKTDPVVHSNGPPKSCCKWMQIPGRFLPPGPELKWFIRRAPPLSLDRHIAVGAMYLQSLSTTGGWNRASWKRDFTTWMAEWLVTYDWRIRGILRTA